MAQSKAQKAYKSLIALSREAELLASCGALLSWDREVGMPRGGAAHRAEQLALLAGLVHDRATDPRHEDLLGVIDGSPWIGDEESPPAVNVRELRRSFDRERKIPRRLVEETARVTALASQAWADARERDEFEKFAPWLDQVFALARERADALGYEGVRYDALLDDFEPGMTTAELMPILAGLEAQLVPLVDSLRDGQPRASDLSFQVPLERQKILMDKVARSLGFDLDKGRIDITEHPFCTSIGPGDVRIALRYHADDFNQAFFALLHETGHAMYEQGLDTAHFGTPMGQAVSLGVHESQSRLWENLVGRSDGFWRHFYPELQKSYAVGLHDTSRDAFRKSINRVKPGLIRIHADEVTYSLHIIVRVTLERAFVDGDLRAEDLPAAWSELYNKYLGIVPDTDRDGCLQDIHWSEGLIGYFPTYTLGNVYAAQLFKAADNSIGPLEESFAAGEFAGLLGWLRENVHRHGKRYPAATLIERVTGGPLDSSALVESLSRRYT